MVTSNVMRCALLAASVNKQNHLFQSNYLAGLAALGLYELEACGAGGTGVPGGAVPVHRRGGGSLHAGPAGDDAQAGRPGVL